MQSIRRTVAVLSGTVFLVMIGISIISPAVPQYGLTLGATAFMAGPPVWARGAVLAFNYWVLLAVRLMEGVGSAFYVTSSLATLAKRIPPDSRGRYMGIYVNARPIGQVIGPVIGGAVVLAWGIRAPFAAYALLAALGMVLITFGLEPQAGREASGAGGIRAVKRPLR